MALPRMNNLSFWILPVAGSLLISTMFMAGGGPNFGWTFLRATFYNICATIYRLFHFCDPLTGFIFHYGRDQYYRHNL